MNRPLRVLLVSDTLVLISGAMIVPIYAIYVDKIGGDILDAGIAAGVFALVAGIAVLVAGKWGDHHGHLSRIVGTGYILNAIGFLLYMLISNIWQLVAVQALVGLSQACIAPAFDALFTKHIGSEKKASSRWSIWEASYYFAIAIGSGLGALIVKLANFDTLFVIMSLMCFASGIYVLTRPKRLL